MCRLIVLGAGGHGKVVADVAECCGYTEIAFLDDGMIENGVCSVNGYAVLGKLDQAEHFNDGDTLFVIGIGNNTIRRDIAEKYALPWVTLVHPSAVVAKTARLDVGTVVMANAVVNPCVAVGRHCIVNTGSVVEHDNVIADYAHISPRAVLGGSVTIGAGTHIGLGASVKNGVRICENCVVGVGAVVVKNIEEQGTYIGVPARRLK